MSGPEAGARCCAFAATVGASARAQRRRAQAPRGVRLPCRRQAAVPPAWQTAALCAASAERCDNRSRASQVDALARAAAFCGASGAPTTAQPRPQAYIPETLGIPKPYGRFSLFKPGGPGGALRHASACWTQASSVDASEGGALCLR